MPKPYSIDLREKIVAVYQNEEYSMRCLAKRFKVSFSFVSSLLRRVKQTGEMAPKPHGGGQKPSINAQGHTFIKELIESQPDLTLDEMTDKYNKHFEPVGSSTIDRTLTKLNITRKKKTRFDERKNTPENKEKRQNYEKIIEPFEPKDLIFIDETC